MGIGDWVLGIGDWVLGIGSKDTSKDSNRQNDSRRGNNNKDDKDKNRNNPDSSKENIKSQIYIRKNGINSNKNNETQGRRGNERNTNSNVQNTPFKSNPFLSENRQNNPFQNNETRPGQRGVRPTPKTSQSSLNDRSGRRENYPNQNINKERPSNNGQNPYQRNREPENKQIVSNRRQPNQMVTNTLDANRPNNRNNPNVSTDKDKPSGQRITKITEVRTSTNTPNQGGRRPNPRDSNRSINQNNPNVSKDKDRVLTQRITKITEVKSTVRLCQEYKEE